MTNLRSSFVFGVLFLLASVAVHASAQRHASGDPGPMLDSAHIGGYTKMAFPEAMMELQNSIERAGFVVTRVQRVDVGLQKMGYTTGRYRVVFFAKPEDIADILRNHPAYASFLPLSIAIYEDANGLVGFSAPNYLSLKSVAPSDVGAYLDRWSRDVGFVIAAISAGDNELKSHIFK